MASTRGGGSGTDRDDAVAAEALFALGELEENGYRCDQDEDVSGGGGGGGGGDGDGDGDGSHAQRARALYHRCKAVAATDRSRGAIACNLAGALVGLRGHWWDATGGEQRVGGTTPSSPSSSSSAWGATVVKVLREALELVAVLGQYYVHMYTLPD